MAIKFNANEIFEMGVQIEKNGKAFYQAAAKKAKEEKAKKLFTELADWEDSHITLFQKLQAQLSSQSSEGTSYDPENEVLLYLKAAADSHVFLKDFNLDKMVDQCKTSLDAVHKAMEFEKDSVVLYVSMKHLVPASLGSKEIDKLIAEELKHIQILNDKKATL